ncbi:hypothetical protein MNBD_GAMMA24-1194, partial [hydrothermal vent metagenome]
MRTSTLNQPFLQFNFPIKMDEKQMLNLFLISRLRALIKIN